MPEERTLTASPMSSIQLLALARQGDRAALDLLCARYLPIVWRWAHGRLPLWARDISDTTDLVQDVLLQTLRRVDAIEPQDAGALRPYLHQAVLNRIRDELRKRRVRPGKAALDTAQSAASPSPFDQTARSELRARYEAALGRLSTADRELVVGRLDLEMTYDELALATGRAGANAARSAVVRALLKLADEMRHAG